MGKLSLTLSTWCAQEGNTWPKHSSGGTAAVARPPSLGRAVTGELVAYNMWII